MDNLPVFVARAVVPAGRHRRGRWLAWFGAGVASGLALATSVGLAVHGAIVPVLVALPFAAALSSRWLWTSIES